MTKKVLIALTILLMFGGSIAQAHPAWGVTTAMAFEWAKKQHEVQVYMKMVRWADLYVELAITIVQQTNRRGTEAGWEIGDFVGCTWIEICNNFEQLHIDAVLVPVEQNNVAEHWYIAMTESGDHGDNITPSNIPLASRSPWDEDETSITVDVPGVSPNHQLNLTGSHGWVLLCVKATGVDPQGLEFDPTNPNVVMKAADIYLTYYPELPPDVADFAHTNIGTAEPFFDDNVNPDDVYWNSENGGGGGIPNGQNLPNQFPAI